MLGELALASGAAWDALVSLRVAGWKVVGDTGKRISDYTLTVVQGCIELRVFRCPHFKLRVWLRKEGRQGLPAWLEGA
jgi:hypothetical protein